MERRDFLKVAALTGAAIAVPGLDAAAARRKDERNIEGSQDKPVREFRFRPDGKFKILQITDTHYIAGNPKSERALKNLIQMLDVEKPDLVIHTGDIVYGNPADKAAREILQPIVDRGIPFAVALGNHESDFELKREEIFEVIRRTDNAVDKENGGVTAVDDAGIRLMRHGTPPVSFYFISFSSRSRL
jgi:hypothetical protein